jgi:hypothetical protein
MLPKKLSYGSKVESAYARSYRTNIAPQNGTQYGLGENIILNIPTRNNLVLVPTDSYLKFNLTVTNTVAAANNYRLDSVGAHALIQRIRIFHGSNLLQDIDNYGLLAKMLFDVQLPTDCVYGKQNILAGTRSDLNVTFPTAAAAAAAGNTSAQIDTAIATALAPLTAARVSANHINSGIVLGTGTAAAASTTVKSFALNLISLVGSLNSQNYLPLFACTSAPLRVEIQLVDAVNKFCACTSNTSTIRLTETEYVANFIELGDQAMSMIYDSLGGSPLQFVVPDYRNYQGTHFLPQNVSTQVNFSIPAKFSSLKSIFVITRENTGADTFFPLSCITKGLQNYYFRVGSTIMPSKAVDDYVSCFAELVKAIGSIGDYDHQPSIDFTTYTQTNGVAGGQTDQSINSGSFYIGLDLENYAASDRSKIFAGYNSNTDDIYAVLQFLNAANAATVRFDAFALFDEVVIFENNTCYVKF